MFRYFSSRAVQTCLDVFSGNVSVLKYNQCKISTLGMNSKCWYFFQHMCQICHGIIKDQASPDLETSETVSHLLSYFLCVKPL